jgi:hypothetical protein
MMHQKCPRAKKVVYETLWLSRVHSPAGGGSGAGVEPKDFPFLDARDILSNILLLKTAGTTCSFLARLLSTILSMVI